MAAARGPTIAPDRVTDIDSWVKFSKRYINVKTRPSDGAMVVLDPTTMNMESPAKIIPFTKAVDAIAYMVQGTDSNIRAQASTRLETLSKERQVAVGILNEQIRQKQKELLQAHQEWKRAASVALRIEAAQTIGQLQKDIATLDTQRQQTRFPHRIVQTRILSRMAYDYETRDARALPIHCMNLMNTVAADRLVGIH